MTARFGFSTACGITIGGSGMSAWLANGSSGVVGSALGTLLPVLSLLHRWCPVSTSENRLGEFVNTRNDDEFEQEGSSFDLEWDEALGLFVVVAEDGQVVGTLEIPQ